MISIIIPTYNEEENIIKLINKIFNIPLKINIIVVDDSKSILRKIRKVRKVKYIHRGKKLGRGSAVLVGIKKSLKNKRNRIIIEMDADFSHRTEEILPNINYFNKNKLNFLIASRYLKESKILNWPISRHILSKFSNLLAKLMLRIPIQDYTNGFRFYDRKAAEHILKKCSRSHSSGFILLSEIAMELYINKFKLDERPTIFVNRSRGESKASFSEIINSLFGLLRLFIKYKLP
jgi:dolichol-phosphate mannosyltransferase